MEKLLRVEYVEAYYHVINWYIAGEYLFHGKKDATLFLLLDYYAYG
jgi:hypothetical protein